MELFRRFFVQIRTQLTGLTVSQKLLIGLLSLVMVGTIFWVVVSSAKPQMVPLIEQPMTAEQINKVEMAIKGKYEYQVSGDKVLVPVEQAYAIRGALASEGALPKDLTNSFSAVIANSTPFKTDAMNTREWNNALQMELTKFLRAFPYVEDGSVIIAHGQPAGLGKPAMPSTATVNVKTRRNAELSGNQVLAIVEMVSGAVAGMKREDVHVIGDGMRAYHAPSSDTPMPADLLAYKKTLEDELTRKLFGMFDWMGDVKIAINVVPDLSVRKIDETRVDPKNSVVKPLSETNRDTSSTEGNVAEGQPGVPPNTQLSVTDTGSGGRRSGATSAENKTENKVVIGQTTTQTILPAGVELKDVTASLSLPRSYFVSLYRRMKGDAKAEPKDDDADLAKVIKDQIARTKTQARNAIGVKSDDQIVVDWYDDTIVTRTMEIGAASTVLAGGNWSGLVAQYARQGVLAVVALGALGMMLMMVRRAVPGGAEEVSTGAFFGLGGGGGGKGKRRNSNVEQLDAADDVFGEANEGEAVLTGIELDDETLASRKMVDEVSIMIKENPENAASLVKRWMTKTK